MATESKQRGRVRITIEPEGDPDITPEQRKILDDNVRHMISACCVFTSKHIDRAKREGLISEGVDEGMLRHMGGWALDMTDEEIHGETESILDDPELQELLDQLGISADRLAGVAVIHVVGPNRRHRHGSASEAPGHGDDVGHGSSPQDGDSHRAEPQGGSEDLRRPDPAGTVPGRGMDEAGDGGESATA